MADVIAFPALGTTTPARVGDVVAALSAHLAGARVPDADREARDIIAAVVDMPRFWPSMHREASLDVCVCERAWDAARKRASGAPFAYAVGRAAFRHLTLDVDERVLIPRPETELLVDEVLACALPPGGLAIDVGTGSGALALALAMEGRFAHVIATDLSLDALDVARANHVRRAHAMKAPVEFRHGSLLAPVAGDRTLGRARLVVSNPPYIAHHEASQLPRAVRDWEPALALFSGPDGMD